MMSLNIQPSQKKVSLSSAFGAARSTHRLFAFWNGANVLEHCRVVFDKGQNRGYETRPLHLGTVILFPLLRSLHRFATWQVGIGGT